MARMLRTINVGMACMAGVASGYYIFEPLVRSAAELQQEQEAEIERIAEAVEEPVSHVRECLKADAKDLEWSFTDLLWDTFIPTRKAK